MLNKLSGNNVMLRRNQTTVLLHQSPGLSEKKAGILESKKKREQRKRMSSQKKRRIKEHDFAYRRKKRQEERQKCRPSPSEAYDQSTSGQFYSTPSAKRKAASWAKGMLPADAGKFADAIDHIIANATSNKKAALREKGLHSPGMKQRKLDFHTRMSTTLLVKESHQRNEDHWKVRRAITAFLPTLNKHRMLNEISRTTEITWKYLMQYTNTKDEEEEFLRKKRSDTISQETVQAISRHYSDHEATTPSPNYKLAQGEFEGKILNKLLDECYEDFTQKILTLKFQGQPTVNEDLRMLCLTGTALFLQCLCDYCVNVENVMNVINQTCTGLDLSDMNITTSDITSSSLCLKLSTDSDKACIDHQCATCGVHLVRDHFGPVIDASAGKELSFYQWENHQYEKHGIRKTKIVINKKTCISAEIVDRLCELITPHSRHLFNTLWEQKAFSNIKSSPASSPVKLFLSSILLRITARFTRMRYRMPNGPMTKSYCFQLWHGIAVQFVHLKPYQSGNISYFCPMISSMIIMQSMRLRWLDIISYVNIT